ncbi:MAG: thioredoxin family protein [Oscillospiraceae bacterium]|nr:thioredoxin family protein [Oscillospiraceae bacterium]
MSNYFDEKSSEQIKQVIECLTGEVSVLAVLEREHELSEKIRKFLNAFHELTERVPIVIFEKGENSDAEEKVGTDIYPVIALMRGDGTYSGVSFHGLPVGHELESFVLAIYNVAGPGQPISDETSKRINKIDKTVDIKIGVNLTCTMCPNVVQTCQHIAALSSNVSAAMIDLGRFPEMRKQHRIMSVPVIIIDNEKTIFGNKNIEEVLDILMQTE